MKALLSILLGLMLVTSTLVGIAYATPTMQPQGSDNNGCGLQPPNNVDNVTVSCHGAGQRDHDHPPPHCFDQKSPDRVCGCKFGITPHSLETSDIHADLPCE